MEAETKQAIKQELKVKEKENVEIRDHLAMERTKLANERTLLAYLRTAMALVVAGFSMIEFFTDDLYKLVGLAFIPLGLAAGVYGFRRFLRKKKEIQSDQAAYTPTSHTHAAVVQAEVQQLQQKEVQG
jgi:putative membrane protein